ncbi:MAG: hypothetical protein A2X79_04700, partial [Desulfuromonadaceae bacterium GWB2_53_15]
NKMTITATVDQAFSQDAILVVGEGVPKKGTTGGQRRLTAKTAAKVVAQRRLAEMLEGVAIVSETTVKDSELVSDAIKTAVTGFIKGTQVVMEDWSSQEETALVIIKVGMSGPKSFAALMYEKILTEPKVKQELDKPAYTPPADVPPPVAAVQAYDGLIIDATDYSFRPALINRIFNPKGDVLYDPAKISQKVLVEQGCGEYTNSVDKAKAALGKRGVKNPLVVKASGTVSPSDLQVSDDTAVKVFTANQASGFMADARVAFVLK